MPRELSSIGTSDKVCKKENSQKPEKIWLPFKKITSKSEFKLPKDKDKKKVERTIKLIRYLYFLMI